MYSLGNMVFPRPFLEYTKNEICSFLPVMVEVTAENVLN